VARITDARPAGWAVGIAALLLALLAAVAPPASAQRAEAPRVVETESGPVRGTQEYGYRLFQGIPYAAAPVGDLRFRAPRPVEPWTAVRDATAPGEQCAQLVRRNNPETFGEDCLNLNVWTPAGGNTRRDDLPVMVWIHGGSWVYGTGANYDASKLVLQGDVVVVTINYRLGPIGFLAHPALSAEGGANGSGNLTLQDQQAALRWVRDNIEAFGGDPRRVTIFGESAGASSVCANLVSPASAGLFHRAIAQSYSCAQDYATQAQAEAAGVAFAGRVGCTDAATAAACLRGKSAEQLLRAWTGGAFVAGNGLMPLQPSRALATGSHAQVPLLHGNNRDENRLFVPLSYGTSITAERYEQIVRSLYGANADQILARYPVDAYPSPIIALSTLQTDAPGGLSTCTHIEAYELASVRRRSERVYAYQFRDRTSPPFIDFPNFEDGAMHANELPYLFPRLFGGPLTRAQERLSDAMVGYWTTFARKGNPNGRGLPRWSRYREPRDVLGLALPEQGGIRPVDVAEESNCDFWADLRIGQD